MMFRRAFVAAFALAVAVLLVALLLRAIAPGGWTVAKLAMLLGCLGQAPWVGLCAANGTIGFARLLRGLPSAPPLTVDPPATAIAVAVRNEAMLPVLAALRRLCAGLDPDRFTAFVLSDSDRAHEAAERAACAPDIRYRRRATNEGYKAGNVMDFLDRHADGFDLMLVLDADSRMSPAAVRRLVGAMQANPLLGIVQHLTVGLPAASPFPRLFQFGMRAGMRSWAAGQDWWQGDEGPYWGHNAVLRIAPFRAHARLPPLPDGSAILSHDQIEAALLREAGWGVRVLVNEDGSHEANPTTLPEFLRRDARWLAGNLQYRHLLMRPGFRPMGRWQMLQAMLLFTGAPFALLFLAGAAGAAARTAAAAGAAATDRASPFPIRAAVAFGLAWLAALYAPKLLGYVQSILAAPRARPAWASIAAETLFTLLLDPIAQLSKTGAMLRALSGHGSAWPAQDRAASGVSWRVAARGFLSHTLVGLLAAWCFAQAGMPALLLSLPFIGGLVVAIPFCVLTADPGFGRWLQRHRIAATPEELPPYRASSASTA